ncbi:hypothetical protein GCM10010510_62200 [Streptomyces anandii JCM 4720]|nr:hypothetical protein GCM10010510_62200 [Streptomyces anandii JCM 4720]
MTWDPWKAYSPTGAPVRRRDHPEHNAASLEAAARPAPGRSRATTAAPAAQTNPASGSSTPPTHPGTAAAQRSEASPKRTVRLKQADHPQASPTVRRTFIEGP